MSNTQTLAEHFEEVEPEAPFPRRYPFRAYPDAMHVPATWRDVYGDPVEPQVALIEAIASFLDDDAPTCPKIPQGYGTNTDKREAEMLKREETQRRNETNRAYVLRHSCPKIPQGYGTDPGDCACGNCPEVKGGI